MVNKRLIPVLFLRDGYLVRSENFSIHQILGNPVTQVKRYNSWNVDELIYIDISKSELYSPRRNDLGEGETNAFNILDLIKVVSKSCFMPLTVGGKIKTLDDIHSRINSGADKITINSAALDDSNFIKSASREFGSQAIVLSIDVKINGDGHYKVFGQHGSRETNWTPENWAQEVENFGAGEIFLNSVDRDGTAKGYDIELISRVVNAVNIPVIACGGASGNKDFVELISNTDVSAVAAGNLFHFKELSYPMAKKYLKSQNLNFR